MSVNSNIDAIFCQAIEIDSPAERDTYLELACGDDRHLRGQVVRLLDAHFHGGSILDSPPNGLAATIDRHIPEKPGDTIGPYKLVQPIGEGGFGVVFLAEQERPVRRRVALKVIKPGMDTRAVVARFEAERQALAMMDHPNIAKVLDAGTTGVGQAFQPDANDPSDTSQARKPDLRWGRPYFVMELVQGVPITEYCDQCNLTTRERLALFISVCQAVQHAHQKGIIHRDIKPSNVLIAMQDGQPAPKIIDFGVAKAIGEQPLTERTLTTSFAQMVGTPMYMSPEQAELSPLGVDTRSDIYSLGVLLYELLTGATPFDKDRLHSASYDEMRRIIREEEPPRPSARLSSLSLGERAGVRANDSLPLAGRDQTSTGDPSRRAPTRSVGHSAVDGREARGEGEIAAETANQATTIAEHRRTDLRRLSQTVRGELDWIVMKCLEKVRNRRYETASALAADLQCYLQDEPVQACPPSAWYRFRKFARRNKRMLVTATLLGVMLLVLAGSFGWMARSSATQRFRNAEAVAALLEQCEDALRADRADRAGIALEAADRRAADGGADDLADRLARCRADLRLLRELDDIDTFRWTRTQGRSHDPAVIAARWRPALAAYGVTPDIDPSTDAAKRVNESLIRDRVLTALDLWLGLAERSAWVRAVLRSADPDPYRDAVRDAFAARDDRALSALAGRPEALAQPARFAAVLGLLGESVTPERRRAVLESALRARPGDLDLLMVLGQLPENRPEFAAEQLRWYQAALAAHPENVAARNNLGVALRDRGDLDGAIACFEEAVRLDPTFAIGHSNVGIVLAAKGQLDAAIAQFREAVGLSPANALFHDNLGMALSEKGYVDNAIAAYREAIRLDPKLASAHINLGAILCNVKRDYDGAIIAFQEAIRIDPTEANSHSNLGNALWGHGELDAAIAAYKEAIRLDPKNALAHSNLGRGLFEKGDMDGAIAAYKEAARLEPVNPALHHNLGLALAKQGNLDDAIAAYREVIRLDPKSAAAWHNLGGALLDQGDVDGAIAAYKEAARLEPANPARRHNLGLALRDQGDVDRAITELREAVRLDPTYAAAHGELGAILCDGAGDHVGAIVALKEAIRLDPTNATFRSNLGGALLKNEDADGAITLFREAIRLDPTDATFHSNLGGALFENGDVDGAIVALKEAIRLDPKVAGAHYNLGNALQQKGKLGDALAAYREAVRLDPKDADSHNKLAWLQAAGPDGARDGKQAVVHAERACELTEWKDPNHIDTLAAAHAEAGEFERAVEFQKKVLSFPDFKKADGTGGRERLDLYVRKMPYRDPTLTSKDHL